MNGYKTYTLAILTLIAAVYLFATKAIEVGLFTELVSGALIAAGIRHGIAK